jgi:hypothetical protein
MNAASSANIIDWRHTVEQHYGSLDQFKDATTVRFMLQGCRRLLDEDAQMLRDLVKFPKEHQDWVESFADERQRIGEIEKELAAWLKERGLT